MTAPGSYQSEIGGCVSDWAPECLASQLFDVGGGQFELTLSTIPAGSYEFKIALNQSWVTNYGLGGAEGGSNLPFVVPTDFLPVTFTWDSGTHIPGVSVAAETPEPSTFALAGFALALASFRRRALS